MRITYDLQQRQRTFMTFAPTTPLDSSENFFDSAETEILSTAFAKAWAFVEFDPMLETLSRKDDPNWHVV
jgi:hypothetical protein